ncbi:hypothetical protein [Prochlorothrix hollandica]|uniref:Uncharacterized protein n=1 Tax=Prochlorothrix hollandica PCC 9006 = CALU 1027 TaxID=317619 RepID=A0A0M2Q3B4_PROHO|nr:hypothetical protein [Prochlorothrix hollandica]KKJ01077.1 hypothetical protein PROH_01345 [Prochlorothrix hollandica PCC 9006 = CALU 1027]
MKVEHFNAKPPTLADSDQVSRVRSAIQNALADGVLSRQDNDQILTVMYADGKVSQEECELFRVLQAKIWRGEVCLED